MGKRIKIVYLISSLKRCGPVNVIFSIINNMDMKKFEPIIITFKKENNNSRMKDFIACGVELRLQSNVISCFIALKALIRGEDSVILHSHGLIPDLINFSFMNSNYINVSTIHSNLIEDYVLTFGKKKGTVLLFIHQKILKHLICISCSNSVKTQLFRKKGLTSVAIPNGVHFENELLSNSKDETYNNKYVKLMYCGTISKRKNVEFLIQSVIKLGYKNITLDVVGEGPDLGLLKSKYKKNSNIHFLGFKSNVTHEIEKADIIVSASESEGLPLAILEGLSFGKTLLLSGIDSHIEILKNKNWGQSFKINDFDSFADSLKKVICDINNDTTIFKEAKMYFSDELMTKEYEKAYLNIINGNKNIL